MQKENTFPEDVAIFQRQQIGLGGHQPTYYSSSRLPQWQESSSCVVCRTVCSCTENEKPLLHGPSECFHLTGEFKNDVLLLYNGTFKMGIFGKAFDQYRAEVFKVLNSMYECMQLL